MKAVCSHNEFEHYFGTLYSDVLLLLTNKYPLVVIKNEQVYFQFKLDVIFKESFELFSVDPSLVPDMFVVNNLFNDESVDPELVIFIMDWFQTLVEYDPITKSGELCFSFDDIQNWYGEEFDDQMNQLYPEYESLKEYIKLT